jgi:predicted dehydrogenase
MNPSTETSHSHKANVRFAAIGLNHSHIYGQTKALLDAGAELVYVYAEEDDLAAAYLKAYPQVRRVADKRVILEDASIQMVVSATIPDVRAATAIEVMRHGKDYFTDKCPFTTLAQLAEAREVVAQTGRKYAVYYSERLHNESAVFAGQLIHSGAIGRVLQVIGLGPHRINVPSRPAWFFELARYGGILCDIGSHQVEQFLYYSGATDGTVMHSKVANYAHPDYPELQDFGDATIVGNNGATNYFRVDWFTPNGLSTWGDGRTIIMGTQGYIELRKYVDVTRGGGDQVYLVDQQREQHFAVAGQVGYPFFGELIRDCLNRTELAMAQAHTFKAAELAMQAQAAAMMIA